MRAASPRHGRSLAYARFVSFTGDGARIVFGPDATFHKSQVFGLSRALVEGELSRSLGRPIKLTEDQSAAFETAPRSIAEVEAGERNTREAQIKAKVEAHPALRALHKHLGGKLEHVSFLEPAPRVINAADDSDERPPVD